MADQNIRRFDVRRFQQRAQFLDNLASGAILYSGSAVAVAAAVIGKHGGEFGYVGEQRLPCFTSIAKAGFEHHGRRTVASGGI